MVAQTTDLLAIVGLPIYTAQIAGESWTLSSWTSRLRSHRYGSPLDRRARDGPTARGAREEGGELMKTMTCKQLGGPCDHQHHGQTADDVIKAQDRHLKEMVAGGDTAHAPALKEMKGRWRHPVSGMGWYRAAKRNFAALPED
jgi:hypothetical protein